MKNTWMLTTINKYNYLNNFFFSLSFFFIFFLKNMFFLKFFLKLKKKILQFLDFKKNYERNIHGPLTYFFNQTLESSINEKLRFNDFKAAFIKPENPVSNFYFLKNKNETLFYKLLNFFFLFSFSMYKSAFKKTSFFNFFFVNNYNSKLTIVNVNKFIDRWLDSYNLLFNVFYYNFHPLVYASPLFKNETLSLNWFYNNWDVNLWRYYFSFFVFKVNKFTKKINFFYEKLKETRDNFFIVTDCLYHFKNLYYFRKTLSYTIGLVNVSQNPWIVSYPILTFADNYLNQLFFFKLIFYLSKQALKFKFFFFKKIWINHYFLKNL